MLKIILWFKWTMIKLTWLCQRRIDCRSWTIRYHKICNRMILKLVRLTIRRLGKNYNTRQIAQYLWQKKVLQYLRETQAWTTSKLSKHLRTKVKVNWQTILEISRVKMLWMNLYKNNRILTSWFKKMNRKIWVFKEGAKMGNQQINKKTIKCLKLMGIRFQTI